MPNGEFTPMSEYERDDFFHSLLTSDESVSRGARPSFLEFLRRAIEQRHTRDVVEDAFGAWGQMILSLLDVEESPQAGLPTTPEIRDRLISTGMDDRLADAVLSDSGTAVVHLLDDTEVRDGSWPRWEELRHRAAEQGWRQDIIERTFGEKPLEA